MISSSFQNVICRITSKRLRDAIKLLEPALIIFVVTLTFNVLVPSALECTPVNCVVDESTGLCIGLDGMATEVEGIER